MVVITVVVVVVAILWLGVLLSSLLCSGFVMDMVVSVLWSWSFLVPVVVVVVVVCVVVHRFGSATAVCLRPRRSGSARMVWSWKPRPVTVQPK